MYLEGDEVGIDLEGIFSIVLNDLILKNHLIYDLV